MQFVKEMAHEVWLTYDLLVIDLDIALWEGHVKKSVNVGCGLFQDVEKTKASSRQTKQSSSKSLG